jgi:hypothetical protein
MSKFGQGLSSGMVESFFKRRPEGWLFAMPLVWPRRTYLVTDKQKASLVGPLRRMWWTQISTGIVAVIGLLTFLEDQPALTQVIVVGSAMVVVFILQSVYAALMIRPLLVGIPTTNERISFSDQFKARAVALPKVFLIGGAVISLLFFVVGLALALGAETDLATILSTVFFGVLTLLYIGFYFARQRANRQM